MAKCCPACSGGRDSHPGHLGDHNCSRASQTSSLPRPTFPGAEESFQFQRTLSGKSISLSPKATWPTQGTGAAPLKLTPTIKISTFPVRTSEKREFQALLKSAMITEKKIHGGRLANQQYFQLSLELSVQQKVTSKNHSV